MTRTVMPRSNPGLGLPGLGLRREPLAEVADGPDEEPPHQPRGPRHLGVERRTPDDAGATGTVPREVHVGAVVADREAGQDRVGEMRRRVKGDDLLPAADATE